MYHSHFDSMTQEGMGLIGMIVVHDRHKELVQPRGFGTLQSFSLFLSSP